MAAIEPNIIPQHSQQHFTTVYNGFEGNVYSLSDIHGDIHSLIISLRDCAKVITKPVFDISVLDPDIELNLSMDITNSDMDRYDETFGYTWCGDNSMFVICGDIIDSCRSIDNRNIKGCLRLNNNPVYYPLDKFPLLTCNQYPQIEIKLLRFINAINRNSLENGFTGKIIKLLGNHDLINVIESNKPNYLYKPYAPEEDYGTEATESEPEIPMRLNYYRNCNRRNVFNYPNIGFQLLFEGGCGLLVMINNSIFLHGQLIDNPIASLYNIILLNDLINDSTKDVNMGRIANHWLNTDSDLFYIAFDIQSTTGEERGILQARKWSDPFLYNERINRIIHNCPRDGYCKCKTSQQVFCDNNVINTLQIFMTPCSPGQHDMFFGVPDVLRKPTPNDVEKLRVVLGHTPQNITGTTVASSFENEISNDNVSTTFGGYLFDNNKIDTSRDNTTFGITGQCNKKSGADYYMYFVDVASSRAFDNDILTESLVVQPDVLQTPLLIPLIDHNVRDRRDERLKYYTRTPQVLNINTTHNRDTISIIKSKMKNTRTHLPRPAYEHYIRENRYNELYKKYLKYKIKYLKLKK